MADAPPVQLTCPGCRTNWPVDPAALSAMASCPGCGRPSRVIPFPALHRPTARGQAGELAVMDGEATCFFHPQKRVQVPCDACGRFLCALCDCEMGDQHLCPACLESGARKHRIQTLEQSRTRWDHIVWTLVLLPLALCGILLPLTALIALGIVFWKRREPASLLDNSVLSLRLASAVALLELVGGTVFWLALLTGQFD